MFKVGKKYGYYPPSLDGKSNGGEYVCIGWSKEGTPVFQCGGNFFASTCPERYKEVKEPVKVSGWVNIYLWEGKPDHDNWFYNDKEQALKQAKQLVARWHIKHLATIYVSGEEGKEPA